MELFLIVILFVVFVGIPVTFAARNIIDPYMNGMKTIDPIKRPTLHRAQRIIRANNVKAREAEALIKFNHFDIKRLEVNKAIEKAIEHNRIESAEEHNAGVAEWEEHFRAITAEEDARKLAEEQARIAEELRMQKAVEAELREKELAIWTANEKARLARFAAEQAALQAEEDRRVAALLEQREKDIQTLSKHHVGGEYVEENQHMFVNVHGLYVRKLPTKDSRIIDNLSQNSWITVNGWISYEQGTVFGNPIWFRLANGQGWIWSGGVHTQATTGLRNLNYMKERGETYVMKSMDGTIYQEIVEPSPLQSMINAEIAAMKQEQAALESKTTNYYQTSRPTGPIAVGSHWFDTSNNDQAHTWDGYVWLPSFHANLITTDRLYPQLKKVKKTDRTKDDLPRLNRDSGQSDFWRGTSYESA